MNASRRAAGASPSPAVLHTLIVGLTVALSATLALLAVIAGRMARRVVTPAGRIADTRIVDVDVAAQTITLSKTADTVLPGRYGLFTAGTADYVKVGSVLSDDESTVTRKLLTHIGPDSRLAADAAFSGWYFDHPEQLHLPFESELVGAAVGPCPAWVFPSAQPSDTWVIQVHGRGTTRAECLRAVPLFHGLGITSMLVSYRNDGSAPRSRSGAYALGATEWRDVDAAIGVARKRGARRIIVMGWSMGGAIALQVALNSAHRDLLAGIVLESPVIDWRRVLSYQARQLGLPAGVAGLAIGALGTDWATPLTGTEARIPFERLDAVARAGELRHPVLILHSDDDGFVPPDASYDLVAARPDLVEMQTFCVARHTKLWNYDQDRWSRSITAWLERHDLVPQPPAASRR
ncbi:alpha/beta hydrolase family protein [Microbacterium sp.]|uniref:alpha/beta hydrolase family protein n=1 Tax=Microbacterium sp. TaxID=51671 RepID=UPI0039E32154